MPYLLWLLATLVLGGAALLYLSRVSPEAIPAMLSGASTWLEGHERLVASLSALTVACFTIALFISTHLLWRSSKEGIRFTYDIGKDQMRCYVHVERAELTWGNRHGSNPSVMLIVKNTGQTPARWFHIVARSFVRPLEEDGTDKMSLYSEASRRPSRVLQKDGMLWVETAQNWPPHASHRRTFPKLNHRMVERT